jgi:DNA-binding NtrC family response regulator
MGPLSGTVLENGSGREKIFGERKKDHKNPMGALKNSRQVFEKHIIEKALEKNGQNQTRTARMLGIHRNTLLWKMRELDVKAQRSIPGKGSG